jgi:hypothetical protein
MEMEKGVALTGIVTAEAVVDQRGRLTCGPPSVFEKKAPPSRHSIDTLPILRTGFTLLGFTVGRRGTAFSHP